MKEWSFGTDGIRVKIGQEPFTYYSILKLANAISLWLKYKNFYKVLIANDTRSSSSFIKNSLKSIISCHEISVYDCGVMPTPVIGYAMTNKIYDVAIVITASHNPASDNGIKIMTTEGKINEIDETLIVSFFDENFPILNYEKMTLDNIDNTLFNIYKSNLFNKFDNNFLMNKTIVIDCANGAWSKFAPDIFKEFGAEIIVINDFPSGLNINKNSGSCYPDSLNQEILKNHADFGVAFDGDGDRIVMINRLGVILDGDDILAILSLNEDYENEKKIIGTIVSNQGLSMFLNNFKKELLRVNVGDKNIFNLMKKDNLKIGAEPSGHVILRDFNITSDGLYVALKVLQTVISLNNLDMISFKKFYQHSINVPILEKKNLDLDPFKSIIFEAKKKFFNGQIIIRYSGTENLLRIVTEHEDSEFSKKIANELNKKIIESM